MHYTAVLVYLQMLKWGNISSDLLAWVFTIACIWYFFFPFGLSLGLPVCLCAVLPASSTSLPSPSLALSLSQTHYAALFPLFFLSHTVIVIAYGFRRRTLCPGLHFHGEQPRVFISVLSAHSPDYPDIVSFKDSSWRKGGCAIWEFLVLISL